MWDPDEKLSVREIGRPPPPLIRVSGCGSLLQKLGGAVVSAAGDFILWVAGLVGLVGGGLLAMLPWSDDERRSGLLIAALSCLAGGTVLTFPGYYLRRLGRRLAAPTAEELAANDPRPPILLLRSFRDDRPWCVGTRYHRGAGPPGYYHPEDLEDVTFEEALVKVLAEFGPVVAIGRPGERVPPVGASREWVSHDQWRARVGELLGKCHRVVMVLGEVKGEDGLAWEARQLFSLDNPEKIIIVVPPIREHEIRKRWERFRELSLGKMPPHQGGETVVTFSAAWEPNVRRVGAPGQQSYHRGLENYTGLIPRPHVRVVPFRPGTGDSPQVGQPPAPELPIAAIDQCFIGWAGPAGPEACEPDGRGQGPPDTEGPPART
jgi:hypothetical protein